MASEGRAVIHGKPKPLPEKPVARADSIGGGAESSLRRSNTAALETPFPRLNSSAFSFQLDLPAQA